MSERNPFAAGLAGSSASPSPLHPAESQIPTCADPAHGDSPFEWLEGRAHWSRRSFIKGVIASGVAVSAVPYLASAGSRPPPFSGTIFIDPDILTPADPTTFAGLSAAGQGSRTMFDRRVNGWITVDAYLFDASYDDGLTIEIQVNPEFANAAAALVEAEKYAEVIGRLPTALRVDVETVWIHMGVQPFGGGNNNLLIHIGQADLYVADGILEETLVHEAAHTSLDAEHAS